MQDRKLLELAAKHIALNSLDDTSYDKLERLYANLQGQAAAIFDNAFLLFTGTVNPGHEKQQFTDIEYCTGTWSGEQSVSIIGDNLCRQECVRRWLMLDTIADDTYKKFVNEGFYVRRRVLVGAYDVRTSHDGGINWGKPDRSEKLEIITGLYTTPGPTILPEDLSDDRASYDPFHDGPFILERFDPSACYDCNSHVFTMNELNASGFLTLPELQYYSSHQELFKAMSAALDEFDDLLEGAFDDCDDPLCAPA